MIRLSGRFLQNNLIDKIGVQFSKSATIKIPSKVYVLFNFDKSHPIGIAKVIKDEEGLLAEIESGMDDVLELLEDDKIGCGGYYRAVKSHMEYGIKVIDSAELVSISITLVPSSAEYYVSRKETRND